MWAPRVELTVQVGRWTPGPPRTTQKKHEETKPYRSAHDVCINDCPGDLNSKVVGSKVLRVERSEITKRWWNWKIISGSLESALEFALLCGHLAHHELNRAKISAAVSAAVSTGAPRKMICSRAKAKQWRRDATVATRGLQIINLRHGRLVIL